jgi:NAD(P)-dependent dehydrogenase (short-subunit alcohol dehydrogenase family)
MALFSGKSVLVTGSAGGLGKAIAEAYLKAGAKVAICDINKSRLDSAREELSEHGTVFAHSVDVTDEESVKVLVAAVVQQFGSLDVLVSNAAVIDAFGELRALGPPLVAALGGAFLTETAPVGNTDKKTWDHVMAVNITGPFLVSKYAIKQFLVQEPAGGSIVNVGSVAGVRGWIAGKLKPE